MKKISSDLAHAQIRAEQGEFERNINRYNKINKLHGGELCSV
jgi:hypothetical protein